MDWVCDMVRLAKMAAERDGDEVRSCLGPHGQGDAIIYQDGIVLIYLWDQALTVYDPASHGDDAKCLLSITSGEITEVNRDDKILDHLRRKYLLDVLGS